MKPSLIDGRGVKAASNKPTLEKIHGILDSFQIPDAYQKNVLYPMSGFDLTTPLVLFPKAENYLLIDNHSVASTNNILTMSKQKISPDYADRNSSWIKYGDVEGEIFKKLLSSLFAVVPEAKVTEVKFIVDSTGSVNLILRFKDPQVNHEKTVFYLVGELGEIDQRARMSAARTLSYQHMANAFKDKKDQNWWEPVLAEYAPQAIILKGSMSALRQTLYDDLLKGRELMIAPVLRNGGVIVEGAGHLGIHQNAEWAKRLDSKRIQWELTDGDPRFSKPLKESVLKGVEFSYSDVVRVGVYDPNFFN